VSDEHDAFGRPKQPETTDPFGAPVQPSPGSEAPSGWAPPMPPADDAPVAMRWDPPAGSNAVSTGELSGWWRRVGAAIIDTLVVGIVGAIIGAVLGAAGVGEDATTAVSLALGIVLGVVYYGSLMSREGANNGQTLGKQVTGIRVVRKEGQAITFGFALLREVVVKTILFGYVAIVTLYLATILNYLWPLWDAQNRALHDHIVGTLVKRV
jgi:uncharacterized RDD family membrane protein YckC